MDKIDLCPACSLSAIKICNCPKQDKTCANNHTWLNCTMCQQTTVVDLKTDRHIKCKNCDF